MRGYVQVLEKCVKRTAVGDAVHIKKDLDGLSADISKIKAEADPILLDVGRFTKEVDRVKRLVKSRH